MIDGATDETVTDGTCGEASVSGSTITYTTPNDWKGVASKKTGKPQDGVNWENG